MMDAQFPVIERDGDHLICPLCQRRVRVQGINTPAMKTGFWGHYFSGKHRDARPSSTAHTDYVAGEIRRAQAAIAKEEAEETARQKNEVVRRDRLDRAHASRLYRINGGMVDEITEAIESLISMMEPYYSQCDGGGEARDMLFRLRRLRSAAELDQ